MASGGGGSPLVTGEAVALDLRPAALPSRRASPASSTRSCRLVLLAVVGGLATAVSLDVSAAADAARSASSCSSWS